MWDTKVQGLQCRITDKGAATLASSRLKNGRSVRITLGKLSDITVEQAREQATLLNAEIAKGKDPARLRQEKREEYVSGTLRRISPQLRQGAQKIVGGDESRYRLYLAKAFRQEEIVSDIRRADFVALYNHICRQPSPRNTNQFKIGTANRVLRTAGGIFKWAGEDGILSGKPCAGRHATP
ncbi:MAG: Arm DNA-binding domain-containing protein [Candidatus Kapaibacterium sp.]